MKTRTLEELIKTPQLEDGTSVKVRIDKDIHFMGKVVGLASSSLLPYYIVECLDGTLPNETYPYKFVSLPLSEIFTDF